MIPLDGFPDGKVSDFQKCFSISDGFFNNFFSDFFSNSDDLVTFKDVLLFLMVSLVISVILVVQSLFSNSFNNSDLITFRDTFIF